MLSCVFKDWQINILKFFYAQKQNVTDYRTHTYIQWTTTRLHTKHCILIVDNSSAVKLNRPQVCAVLE